jgi:glycosyltransferase involved in cell wall biosynthesis
MNWNNSNQEKKSSSPSVAIAHDYLTQRGGAERVVLLLAKTFPEASIYTSLYDPDGTYPEFSTLDVRTSPLNKVKLLRHQHRLALPLLAPTFSSLHIDADVLICSSSGWAHGTKTAGRKIVFCYAPARWLYRADQYLGASWPRRVRSTVRSSHDLRANLKSKSAAMALHLLAPPLRNWDSRAAMSADRYLTSSTVMADVIRGAYGREAEVLPPPVLLSPDGPERRVPGLEPGYFICIARLLPYKNVQAVVEAASLLSDTRLVVVGDGPGRSQMEGMKQRNVNFLGEVDDATLRWLYRHSAALVSAAFEDYGLTPLEAASFGRPSVVLRDGGFLDTVVENVTGIFFDIPSPVAVATAMSQMRSREWEVPLLKAHAKRYSADSFQQRMRQVVDEELARS